jgi:hypothetical protein
MGSGFVTYETSGKWQAASVIQSRKHIGRFARNRVIAPSNGGFCHEKNYTETEIRGQKSF